MKYFNKNSTASGDHFVKFVLNKNKIWRNSLWSTNEFVEIIPELLYKYIIYNEDGTIFKGFPKRKFILEFLG